MAASVVGMFTIIDRASGPMRKMELQAIATDKAIGNLGDNMDDIGTNKQVRQMAGATKGFNDMERSAKGVSQTTRTANRDINTFSTTATTRITRLRTITMGLHDAWSRFTSHFSRNGSMLSRARLWFRDLQNAMAPLQEVFQKIGAGASFAGGGISGLATALPPLVSVAIVAAPVILALAGAVTALAGSLGLAVGGAVVVGGGLLGGFAAGLGGIAAAVAPAISKVQQLMQAQQQLNQAIQTGAAPSTIARYRKQVEMLKGQSPGIGKFAQQIANLRTEWQKLAQPTQNKFFSFAADALARIKNLLPLIARESSKAMGKVKQVFDNIIGPGLNSKGFRNFIKDLNQVFRADLPGFAHGIAHLGDALHHILHDALPFLKQLGHGFNQWMKQFDEFTKSKKGEKFVRQMIHAFSAWGNLLGSVLHLFLSVMQASGSGTSAVQGWADAINGLANKLQRNPNLLRDWFKSGFDWAGKLGHLIHELVDALNKLLPPLTAIANALGDVTGALGSSGILEVLGGVAAYKFGKGGFKAYGKFKKSRFGKLGRSGGTDTKPIGTGSGMRSPAEAGSIGVSGSSSIEAQHLRTWSRLTPATQSRLRGGAGGQKMMHQVSAETGLPLVDASYFVHDIKGTSVMPGGTVYPWSPPPEKAPSAPGRLWSAISHSAFGRAIAADFGQIRATPMRSAHEAVTGPPALDDATNLARMFQLHRVPGAAKFLPEGDQYSKLGTHAGLPIAAAMSAYFATQNPHAAADPRFWLGQAGAFVDPTVAPGFYGFVGNALAGVAGMGHPFPEPGSLTERGVTGEPAGLAPTAKLYSRGAGKAAAATGRLASKIPGVSRVGGRAVGLAGRFVNFLPDQFAGVAEGLSKYAWPLAAIAGAAQGLGTPGNTRRQISGGLYGAQSALDPSGVPNAITGLLHSAGLPIPALNTPTLSGIFQGIAGFKTPEQIQEAAMAFGRQHALGPMGPGGVPLPRNLMTHAQIRAARRANIATANTGARQAEQQTGPLTGWKGTAFRVAALFIPGLNALALGGDVNQLSGILPHGGLSKPQRGPSPFGATQATNAAVPLGDITAPGHGGAGGMLNLGKLVDNLESHLTRTFGKIRKTISTALTGPNGLKGVVSDLGKTLGNTLGGGSTSILTTVANAFGDVFSPTKKGKPTDLIGQFTNAASNFFQNLTGNATNQSQKTHDNVTNWWQKINDGVDKQTQAMNDSTSSGINKLLGDVSGALSKLGVKSGTTGPAAASATKAGGGATAAARSKSGKAMAATGARVPGVGTQDSVNVAPGTLAAPGELIVNRHTENRVNSMLPYGRTLGGEVEGETKPHYMAQGGRTPGPQTASQRGYEEYRRFRKKHPRHFAHGGRAGGGGGSTASVYPLPIPINGRTDMGVDFAGTGPVVAMGDARVLSTSNYFTGFGQPGWGLVYELLGGTPQGISPASDTIYHYEGIQPSVHTGQIVHAGQRVGDLVPPPASSEIGFSVHGGQAALASDHYTEGQVTAEGQAMRKLLGMLKAGSGIAGGASGGMLKPPPKLKRQIAQGAGAFGQMGQAALDKVQAAGQQVINAAYGGGGAGRVTTTGQTVRGKVSYFTGGTTASGAIASTTPGIALNINPGTDAGWNNPTTQRWVQDRQKFLVSIGGHQAVLPVIDMGPAGFTDRAIDVTAPGVSKLGLSTANFPTDSVGTAKMVGHAKGGRVGFGGWFADGGSYTASSPTLIGIGDGPGSETATITKGASAGHQVSIGHMTIHNHRPGDIKQQVQSELKAAFDGFTNEIQNGPELDDDSVIT